MHYLDYKYCAIRRGCQFRFYIAIQGDSDSVQALLNNGANVNEKCINDNTALMRASMRDHTEIVKLLKVARAKEWYSFLRVSRN